MSNESSCMFYFFLVYMSTDPLPVLRYQLPMSTYIDSTKARYPKLFLDKQRWYSGVKLRTSPVSFDVIERCRNKFLSNFPRVRPEIDNNNILTMAILACDTVPKDIVKKLKHRDMLVLDVLRWYISEHQENNITRAHLLVDGLALTVVKAVLPQRRFMRC
jgi:hypothetical protein